MPQQSWTKETTWVKRVGSSPRSSLALIYPACCKIQLGRMEPYMYRLQSRDLSFCMKPWPIPSFLCRTFAWIYWSEQSNIGSSIRQMRRTAVERGKDADNAPLLLGGQGRGRARYLNFHIPLHSFSADSLFTPRHSKRQPQPRGPLENGIPGMVTLIVFLGWTLEKVLFNFTKRSFSFILGIRLYSHYFIFSLDL